MEILRVKTIKKSRGQIRSTDLRNPESQITEDCIKMIRSLKKSGLKPPTSAELVYKLTI